MSEPSRLRNWLAVCAALAAIFAAAWAHTYEFGDSLQTVQSSAKPNRTQQLNHRESDTRPLLAFRNARTGYTLTPSCPDTKDCTYRLWVTFSGGDSWRGYNTDLPVLTHPQPRLAVLGDRSLLLEHTSDRWLSTDNGRSWEKLDPTEQRPLSRAPDGSSAALRCTSGMCHLAIALPDGTIGRLATRPPLTHTLDTGWHPIRNGMISAVGRDGHGVTKLAISSDAGGSWQLVPAPGPVHPVAATLPGGRVLTLSGSKFSAFTSAGQPDVTLTELLNSDSELPALVNVEAAGDALVGYTATGEVYLAQLPAASRLPTGNRGQAAGMGGLTWQPLDLRAVSGAAPASTQR